MDSAELEQRLIELEARYQEWANPINQFIREGIGRPGADGYTAADFDRELQQIRARQRAQYDPYEEMYELFDRLCPAYLDAAPGQRAEIRDAVSDKGGVLSALIGYVYRAVRRIRTPADIEWLRLALAAVSIENCSKDYRDLLLALAELYVAAEEAGIDPRAEFRAVARRSSKEKPAGGRTPVSRMLGGFSRSAVLKEREKKRRIELLSSHPVERRWREQTHPMTTVLAIIRRDGAAPHGETDPQYLLIQRQAEPYAGKWAMVGGGWEFGEELSTAVTREVREETGLDTTFVALRRLVNERIAPHATTGDGAHFLLFVCEVQAQSGQAQEQSEGPVAWYSPDELQRLGRKKHIIPSDYAILKDFMQRADTVPYVEAEVVTRSGKRRSEELIRYKQGR